MELRFKRVIGTPVTVIISPDRIVIRGPKKRIMAIVKSGNVPGAQGKDKKG